MSAQPFNPKSCLLKKFSKISMGLLFSDNSRFTPSAAVSDQHWQGISYPSFFIEVTTKVGTGGRSAASSGSGLTSVSSCWCCDTGSSISGSMSDSSHSDSIILPESEKSFSVSYKSSLSVRYLIASSV